MIKNRLKWIVAIAALSAIGTFSVGCGDETGATGGGAAVCASSEDCAGTDICVQDVCVGDKDGDGVRKIRIPSNVQEKLSVYMQKLSTGEFMISSLSAMDPDVVEFLEITRNPHLYDSQNSLSGSQSV